MKKFRKAQFLCTESDFECSMNEGAEFLEVGVDCSPNILEINDFVLVAFSTKKTKVHYVGRIEKSTNIIAPRIE